MTNTATHRIRSTETRFMSDLLTKLNTKLLRDESLVVKTKKNTTLYKLQEQYHEQRRLVEINAKTATAQTCQNNKSDYTCINCQFIDEFVPPLLNTSKNLYSFYSEEYTNTTKSFKEYMSDYFDGGGGDVLGSVPVQYFYGKELQKISMDISTRPPFLGFYPVIKYPNQTAHHVFHQMFHHGNFLPFFKALRDFVIITDSKVYVALFETSLYGYVENLIKCDRETLSCSKQYYNPFEAFLISIAFFVCVNLVFTLFGDFTFMLSFLNSFFIKLAMTCYLYSYLVYDYRPGCLPAVPTCVMRDVQQFVTTDFTQCTCDTFSTLEDYSCTKPSCYSCNTNVTIRYKDCDSEGLGILWSTFFLFKWKAPGVLHAIQTNEFVNYLTQFEAVHNFIIKYIKGKPITEVQKSCFYLNTPNIITVAVLFSASLFVLFVFVLPFLFMSTLNFILFIFVYILFASELISITIARMKKKEKTD